MACGAGARLRLHCALEQHPEGGRGADGRLNYDILPIVVQFSEKKQAFYHFITQLCAIVGGVFTVAGIVASVTDKGINMVKKKQELGKLG